jgi:hypothetical protein
VSQKINKTSNDKLWIKLAAAVLVITVAGVFVFMIRFNEREVIATTTTTSSPQRESPASPQRSADENPVAENSEKKDNAETTVQQNTARKKTERRTRTTSPVVRAEQEATVPAENTPPIKQSETSGFQTAQIEQVPADADIQARSKSVTIVFSAKEVNEKYLVKKQNTEATTEEKESSTLKKVLDKAYDLTHNQDPMGELRQKKNEILAMNFKNDKQRNEND